MHLKFMKLFLVMILIPAVLLTSCKKSAAPEIDISQIEPTNETVTMQQEALDNTGETENETAPTATPSPTDEEQETGTEEVEATEEPTVEVVVEETNENPTPEPVATAQPVIQTPGKHIVQAGETLYRIAVTYGTSVEAISQANSVTNPSLIHPGQELTIPSGSTNVTPVSNPQVTPGGNVYIVKQGDNLFRIGLKFGYDQYYLARYNGIDNVSMIYVGQQIRIP